MGGHVCYILAFLSQFSTHVNVVSCGIRNHGFWAGREGRGDAPFVRLDKSVT